MNKPGPISEGAAAIFFAMSAVQVAGYTWQSYKRTYAKFPDATGSFATAVPKSQDSGILGIPLPSQASTDNFVYKLPLIGGIAQTLNNFLSGGTGTQSLTGNQITRLQALPAPPTRLVTALKLANNGKGDLATAANNLLAWGKANGYRQSDMTAYLHVVGVHTLPNKSSGPMIFP